MAERFLGPLPPAAPLARVRIIDEEGRASQPFAEWLAKLMLYLTAPRVTRVQENYDPPPLGPNTTGPIERVDVPGALVGDEVVVTWSGPRNGLLIDAWIESDGVVAFHFINPTTTAQNLDPGTLRIRTRPL